MLNAAGPFEATAGSAFLVLSIVVPASGILLSLLFGGRHAERIALILLPIGLAIASAIVLGVSWSGQSLVYIVGGWAPPLGIVMRADGLSATMMIMTAIVICAVGIFARADFRTPAGISEARAPFAFWILLLATWSAMNLLFVASDLFTLYVALELLTFAAVPLVSLDGRAETLQAALRYLIFAILGSVFYLAGAALLYGAYGTLDISMLSERVAIDPATIAAMALMTAGLLAKTALFPLHLWLPPAHAGAPAAASAVLSALVVKGSFFLLVRLWFDVMPRIPGAVGTQILGALGAAAILFGNVVALRQRRLKLLVAYSTVAQIGYLFLMFPLAFNSASSSLQSGSALTGGILQAISHGTAKSAMFLSAGLMYAALGHDRIAGLTGIGRLLPMTVAAFALGGVSLIGLPPSGGFLAKWLLIEAAVVAGQWWWVLTMLAGGLLTSGYMFLVLVRTMTPAREPLTLEATIPRYQQAAALALALCSLLLGLVAFGSFDTVQIGRPAAALIGLQ
jgi:formate hydrogenlyase subunit 3/multisubunit Na+/H+ antiporter MnhD subunit